MLYNIEHSRRNFFHRADSGFEMSSALIFSNHAALKENVHHCKRRGVSCVAMKNCESFSFKITCHGDKFFICARALFAAKNINFPYQSRLHSAEIPPTMPQRMNRMNCEFQELKTERWKMKNTLPTTNTSRLFVRAVLEALSLPFDLQVSCALG